MAAINNNWFNSLSYGVKVQPTQEAYYQYQIDTDEYVKEFIGVDLGIAVEGGTFTGTVINNAVQRHNALTTENINKIWEELEMGRPQSWKNREQLDRDRIAVIEHFYGLKVLSMQEMPDRFAKRVLFTNGQAVMIGEGRSLSSAEPVALSSACISCGEQEVAKSHTKNHRGQCKLTTDKFWTKVRKLYWHRYSQGKL